jgi:hypothetical protein
MKCPYQLLAEAHAGEPMDSMNIKQGLIEKAMDTIRKFIEAGPVT